MFKSIVKKKEMKKEITRLNEQVVSLKGWVSLLSQDKERYEKKINFQEAKIYDLIHELEHTRSLLIYLAQEGAMDDSSLVSIKARISELTAAIEKGEYQL